MRAPRKLHNAGRTAVIIYLLRHFRPLAGENGYSEFKDSSFIGGSFLNCQSRFYLRSFIRSFYIFKHLLTKTLHHYVTSLFKFKFKRLIFMAQQFVSFKKLNIIIYKTKQTQQLTHYKLILLAVYVTM